LEFGATETYTNYYNTELGYKITSKPGVELSAKLNDSLLPVKGASLNLKVAAEEREETASLSLSHVCDIKNASITLSMPLPTRVFNLSVANVEEKTQNRTVSGELLWRVSQDRNYYLGFQGKYKIPVEEKGGYEIKGVVANKSNEFEGGAYASKVVGDDSSCRYGAWVSSESDNGVALTSHFSYECSKNEYSLDNFASYRVDNDTNLLLGMQVFPQTSFSFGVERSLGKSTKFSFAYASLISKSEESKRSGLRFGVELTN
jgi:hypothetical protein